MAGEPRRVLLKLSGEALAADGDAVSAKTMRRLAAEMGEAARAGVEIAVVVGGGNFLRGRALRDTDIAPHNADYMGMLATVLNGLALADTLAACGHSAALLSALEISGVVTRYRIADAERLLGEGTIVVLAGGTGSPFFTTDTCASLRAVELKADVLLKATKVDGIYSADPKRDAQAKLFRSITATEVLEKQLAVMDATSVAMCRAHGMPVCVFDMGEPGNVKRALLGDEGLGTLIDPK